MSGVDWERFNSETAAAWADGVRYALGEIDRDLGGKRSGSPVGRAGKHLQLVARDLSEHHYVPPVVPRPERVRQSLISTFDACPMSAKFNLQSGQRQRGYLAARGSLAHAAYADAVRWMRVEDEDHLVEAKGMEILLHTLQQRDTPPGDVLHLPMAEIKWLRILMAKFCKGITGIFPGGRFPIERVVDVERRLHAVILVPDGRGGSYERVVTGQPDVMMSGPGEDEATAVDYKTGFAPPSRKTKRVNPETGEVVEIESLSDMGYVQQVVYGWLMLKNFPVLQRVTEHESYIWADCEARTATVGREDMERIEDVLATQVGLLDQAIAAGPESRRWVPSPGSHCGWCPRPRDCPVSTEVGIPSTLPQAQKLAGEWFAAGVMRDERSELLKGWVDAEGPIPVRHSKGRREIGWDVKNVASQEVMDTVHERIPCSKCKAPIGRRCTRVKKAANGKAFFDSSLAPLKTPHFERWSKEADGATRSFKLYEPEDADESPFDELLRAAAFEAGVLVPDKEMV